MYVRVCPRCEKRKRCTRRYSWCDDCHRDYNREYREANFDRMKKQKREYREASPYPQLRQNLKNALRRDPSSTLTIKQLFAMYDKQDGRCALTGIKMTWKNGTGVPLPTALSLDRKDYRKGYTLSNTRIVCYAANTFRGRLTDKELLLYAKAIVRTLSCKGR